MIFTSFNNARIVRSNWLEEGGRRLDCNPYMSGALEAREKLKELSVTKDRLENVVIPKGIYKGKLLKRIFISSRENGTLFLTTSGMMKADLSNEPLLVKTIANSDLGCFVKKGMILVSAAGMIGRMTYCGRMHEGAFACSDILKIMADENRIQPGYLYAFLSSKYGLPLLTSGTYGAIIQHINEEHVAPIPIPRFSNELESSIANFIDSAAESRSESVRLLEEAESLLFNLLELSPPTQVDHFLKPDVSVISSKAILDRCDAYYYSKRNDEARTVFDKSATNEQLGSIAEVFIPGIFKRLYASDPNFGSPYITGGDVFELDSSPERYLMHKVAKEYRLLLRKGMIVIQEAGQLGGLIGRSAMIGDRLDGFSCSNNMIRIVPEDDIDGGYLFVLLNTEYGVRLLSREAAGSSIPHTDEQRVKRISIPWPDKDIRARISKLAIKSRDLRDQACVLESRAKTEIERLIDQGR